MACSHNLRVNQRHAVAPPRDRPPLWGPVSTRTAYVGSVFFMIGRRIRTRETMLPRKVRASLPVSRQTARATFSREWQGFSRIRRGKTATRPTRPADLEVPWASPQPLPSFRKAVGKHAVESRVKHFVGRELPPASRSERPQSHRAWEHPEAREPDAGILQYSKEGDRRFGVRSRLPDRTWRAGPPQRGSDIRPLAPRITRDFHAFRPLCGFLRRPRGRLQPAHG